jgi:pimeloyl-ACP methyl ester carboxylesterase
MAGPTPQPFTVAVPDADVADLRERLARTRWPGDFANDGWRYGTNEDYVRSFVDYWAGAFDWRAAEAAINAVPNFRVTIDGIPIHYLHVRGKGPAPLPLICTHGWPWTFWEFHDVVGPLSDPAAYDGDPADAFDVVVPSLPGFGWSSPLEVTGVTCQRTADLWATLMTDVLGYDRFAAEGGDWGAVVTANLGHAYADRVVGVHESLPVLLGFDYGSVTREAYADEEVALWERRVEAAGTITSHMAVHGTEPQTLALPLNDSPAGLAAWMLGRRRAWSDCDGDLDRSYSREFLATTLSIYWFTQTIGTSMRFYYENFRAPWKPRHDREPKVEVPTAFAQFPRDVMPLPRAVLERHSNMARWTLMERGGHFAPSEAPDLLVDDVREFFRDYR